MTEAEMLEIYNILAKSKYYFTNKIGIDNAEDAIHDCFLAAISSKADIEHMQAYVLGVRKYYIYQFYKHKKTFISTEDISERQAKDTDLERFEWKQILDKVFNLLNPSGKKLLEHCYVLDESNESAKTKFHLNDIQFRNLKFRTREVIREYAMELGVM